MMNENELKATAAQLEEFCLAEERQHGALSDVLKNYWTLIEQHQRLRSDYEEERDSRERYKQLAKGQERNPFVLVLVDGDGYVFDDDLVNSGAEGGQEAARILNDTIKFSLRQRGLEHCSIMVRVYANLVGLSKSLSRAKLIGAEKRSLAPFVASFNRSNELFDFVDAGEFKENADSKVRAMFRQFVDNSQCKHIFFAGCHDVGYLTELTQYSSQRERITLVRATSFHPQFSKLGLRTEEFPNIFRSVPLDDLSTGKQNGTRALERASTPSDQDSAATPGVCGYFFKGQCKYGNSCKFAHIKKATDGTWSNGRPSNPNEVKDWRQKSSTTRAMSALAIIPSMGSGNEMSNVYTEAPLEPQNFEKNLPQAEEIPRGQIAVNKNDHRLDAYIPMPSYEDRMAFTARTAVRKICNNHHLRGSCHNGDQCAFDHSTLPPAILNSLQHIVKTHPCPKRGGCRSLTCLHGHICQNPLCKYRGGKLFCKFPWHVHTQELVPRDFVAGLWPVSRVSTSPPDGVAGDPAPPLDDTVGSLNRGDALDDWEVATEVDKGSDEGALLIFTDSTD